MYVYFTNFQTNFQFRAAGCIFQSLKRIFAIMCLTFSLQLWSISKLDHRILTGCSSECKTRPKRFCGNLSSRNFVHKTGQIVQGYVLEM